MYSPKIREDLIPRIYRAAKEAGVAMTTWVNRLIEEALPERAEVNTDEVMKKRKERQDHERYGT